MRFAAAVAVVVLTAGAAAESERAFVDGVQAMQRAMAGDAGAIDAAMDAFEKLASAEPRNPLYLAYLGSATGVKAREAWLPWSKLKYAEQALDHADRALQLLDPTHDHVLVRGVPLGLETRIVAARLFLAVPDAMFHRRAAGRKLIADVLGQPAFAEAPPALRAMGHLGAAEAARDERPAQELAHLQRVLALAPASAAADAARARLKALGQ